jgi:polyhydroxyalkanoate synthesis regulator phasin
VDELIETKKVKEGKLDERFSNKMEWAQSELDRAKEEASIDYLKAQIFTNQIGEA